MIIKTFENFQNNLVIKLTEHDKDGETYTAFINNVEVGYIRYEILEYGVLGKRELYSKYFTDNVVSIEILYTNPLYRKQKIASKLVQTVLDRFDHADFYLYILPIKDVNSTQSILSIEELSNFYKSFGFKNIDDRNMYLKK